MSHNVSVVTSSKYKRSNYDYDFILKLRNNSPPTSWRNICEMYKVAYPAARRWFTRETLRRQSKSEVGQQTVTKQLSSSKASPPPPPPKLEEITFLDFYDYCWPKEPLWSYKKEWIYEIERRQNIMLAAPRGHGKTMLIAKYIVYLLCKHYPTVTILLISSTRSMAKRIYRHVYFNLKFNKKIHQLMGTDDLISTKDLSELSLWLPSDVEDNAELDPSFKAVGRITEVIGSHPDYLFLEDIIQKTSKAEDTEENLQEWYDTTISYLPKKDTKIVVTYTRKALNDLYARMMESDLYYKLTCPAIEVVNENAKWPDESDYIRNETGQVIDVKVNPAHFQTLGCPNWDLKKLLIYRKMNYEAFEREMQNNPIPVSGLYFRLEDICYYDSLPTTHQSILSMHCDPAFGKKGTADYTAIVVVAWQEGMNRFYVLEHQLEKGLGYDQIIDRFCEVYEKWNRLGYRFCNVSIETNFAQTWLAQGIMSRKLPVVGVDTERNKHNRIQSLRAYFTQHMIYMNRSLPGYGEAYNQIANYDCTDSTAIKKDDFLDALEASIRGIPTTNYEQEWASV